jgi:hypothetical protein
MPGSPKRIETKASGKFQRATYQLMYLAKRPSYEVILASSKDHPPFLSADRISVQIQFRNQQQTQELVFNLQEFEAFYESLGQLVEYIKTEHERRCRQL